MEINEFIQEIEKCYLNGNHYFTRGQIIDLISRHDDKWIMVLKALLIKNIRCEIGTSYLLEKLNFMKDNPEHPELFLDLTGTVIYNTLKGE